MAGKLVKTKIVFYEDINPIEFSALSKVPPRKRAKYLKRAFIKWLQITGEVRLSVHNVVPIVTMAEHVVKEESHDGEQTESLVSNKLFVESFLPGLKTEPS